MAVSIINSRREDSLTTGERYIFNKLKKLLNQSASDSYIYIQPIINNISPDFIVIDSSKGVLVIEVKDWSDDYLESANKQFVICDGKNYQNPIKQVSRYFNIVRSNIESVVDFLDDDGELNIPIYAIVYFVNLSDESINKHKVAFENDTVKVFAEKQLRQLSFDDLSDIENANLSDGKVNAIRGCLFQEILIPHQTPKHKDTLLSVSDLKILDKEQEAFAKRIPFGHYMVTGLPGSGKTVMLLARAIYLAQQNTDWRILILTYTNALSIKLSNQIASKISEMALPSQLSQRIIVQTFHKLCYSIVGRPNQPKERSNEDYYNTFWPKEAIKVVQCNSDYQLYDAILIDEYQDFHVDWFTLCRLICKKYDDLENIYLAGDRLQRIYPQTWDSYKKIGLNIQGRSKLLKKPYRTNVNHMDFALKFLSNDAELLKNINHFYEISKLNHIMNLKHCVDIIHGQLVKINAYLFMLIYELKVCPSDILVLCHSKYEIEHLMNTVNTDIKRQTVTGKVPIENKIHLTTYHSSKGLEAKYCILCSVEKFNLDKLSRTLMYVGMTRASDRLTIHYQMEDGFAKEVSDIVGNAEACEI